MKISDEQLFELDRTHRHCNGDQDAQQFLSLCRALIALAQEVPDLEWWPGNLRGCFEYANTKTGEYHITDSPTLFRVTYREGQDGCAVASEATREQARQAANEHNRKRVLSQLRYGGE